MGKAVNYCCCCIELRAGCLIMGYFNLNKPGLVMSYLIYSIIDVVLGILPRSFVLLKGVAKDQNSIQLEIAEMIIEILIFIYFLLVVQSQYVEMKNPTRHHAVVYSPATINLALNNSTINGPAMNYPGVNHSGVNHSGVNHSGVNHSGVNHSGTNCFPANGLSLYPNINGPTMYPATNGPSAYGSAVNGPATYPATNGPFAYGSVNGPAVNNPPTQNPPAYSPPAYDSAAPAAKYPTKY